MHSSINWFFDFEKYENMSVIQMSVYTFAIPCDCKAVWSSVVHGMVTYR